MPRLLPLLSALLLVIGFGVVDGYWSDRWGPSPDLEQAAVRLKAVPLDIGGWKAKQEKLEDWQVSRAGLKGYLLRTYRRGAASLRVLVVCGKHGPISVHTPDVCYEGAGYARAGELTRREVRGEVPAALWTACFRPTEGTGVAPLRIYWAWTATGAWEAPANPRIAFARSAALYKIYVICNLSRLDEPAEQDPAPGFLRQFLPAVNRALFPDALRTTEMSP